MAKNLCSTMLMLISLSSNALGGIVLSNTLGDGMVLQRAPASATVWGFGTAGTTVNAVFQRATLKATVGTDGVFRFVLPPTPSSTTAYTITFVASDDSTAALNDVLFGEVFLCGGQSNMQYTPHSMAGMNNASAEIASADNFPNIRLFTVGQKTRGGPPLTQLKSVEQTWTNSSAATVGATAWNTFSAVCFLFGRNVYEGLNGSVPIGLVSNNWGGTAIGSWSSAASNAACNAKGGTDLYNPMINPYTVGPMKFNGAIWYQGESDVAKPSQYGCLFTSLISSWRAQLGAPNMWFGFIQIAGWKYGTSTNAGALRQAELAPLLTLKNIGLSTAIDTGDYGNIHPPDKQTPAKRLSDGFLKATFSIGAGVTYPIYSMSKGSVTGGVVTVTVSFAEGSTGSGLTSDAPAYATASSTLGKGNSVPRNQCVTIVPEYKAVAADCGYPQIFVQPSPSPGSSSPPSQGGSTTSTFTVDASGVTLNGAQIEGQHPIYLRSGAVPQDAPVSATLKLSLTPGTTITGVSFVYQYMTGYKGTVGANFTLDVAGTAAYSSPTVNNYPFSKSGGIGAYSPPVDADSKGLRIAVPSHGGGVGLNFHNIDRNLQLALPMTINISCTGSSACFTGPAKPPRTTVWHVVWVGGQSNSVGTNSQKSGYPTWPENPLIQMMCSHGATPTFDVASYPVCGESNVGFSLTFANLLLPTLPKGHGVVLLNTGVGGTGFSDGRWVVPNGPLTVNSINKVNQLAATLPTSLGGTYNFHAMLWHQGEEDAGDNHQHYHATYCQYLQSDLGALIDHFRTNMKGATLGTPFMDGGMLPYWVDAVNGTDGVMSAIYALNTSRPCTGTADSRIFPDYFPGTKTPAGEPGHRSGVTGDVIHFNATQATLMGYQYFEAYKRAVSLDTVVSSAKTKACGSSTVAKTQCTGGPVVF